MKKKLVIISLAVLVFAGSILLVRHMGSTRVVVHAVAPNGVEFCIVQRWGDDMWNSSAYYRKPGGRWGWHYYDHDDIYWIHGSIEVDQEETLFKVYRNGFLTATFNYQTDEFSLYLFSPMRTFAPTDKWLPDGEDPWEQRD